MFYFENAKGENVTLWYYGTLNLWYVDDNYFATHECADWTHSEYQFFSLHDAVQYILDFWWDDLTT